MIKTPFRAKMSSGYKYVLAACLNEFIYEPSIVCEIIIMETFPGISVLPYDTR